MYRDYRHFDVQSFRKDLQENLGAQQNDNFDYSAFEPAVETILNRHAPHKKKYVKANDSSFMQRYPMLCEKLSCYAHNYEINMTRKRPRVI